MNIKSNLVTQLDEVDPVNWREIMSDLGGYWVYVGAGFGIFFAVKKGTLELVPSEEVLKIWNCCRRLKKTKIRAELPNISMIDLQDNYSLAKNESTTWNYPKANWQPRLSAKPLDLGEYRR
jgi:hypothetical protein